MIQILKFTTSSWKYSCCCYLRFFSYNCWNWTSKGPIADCNDPRYLISLIFNAKVPNMSEPRARVPTLETPISLSRPSDTVYYTLFWSLQSSVQYSQPLFRFHVATAINSASSFSTVFEVSACISSVREVVTTVVVTARAVATIVDQGLHVIGIRKLYFITLN